MLDERMVPYDLEAEKAVCGSLLIDGESIFNIKGLVVEDFFTEQNRVIFAACMELFDKQVGINQITVARELADQEKLEGIGGAAYLSHLVSEVPTSLHIEYFSGIVRNLANKRRLITLASQINSEAYGAESAEVIARDSMKKLLDFQSENTKSGLVLINEVAREAGPDVAEWIEGKREIQGYPTGFKALDRHLSGLQKGKLYICGARPSIGKTQLMLNIAKYQAKKGLRIAIYSLEQSKKSLMERLVLSEARLNRYKITRANPEIVGPSEESFWQTWEKISKLPIRINDASRIKTTEAMIEVMAQNVIEGVDVMFFDYINLAGDQDDSEIKRIGNITENLRVTAKNIDIPVFALAQLSRAPELREDHHPIISDLRDSGEIEQLADVILLPYREEKYYDKFVKETGEDENGKKETITRPVRKNVMEISIAKNKEGEVGSVEIYYEAFTGFMADLAKDTNQGVFNGL